MKLRQNSELVHACAKSVKRAPKAHKVSGEFYFILSFFCRTHFIVKSKIIKPKNWKRNPKNLGLE